MCQIITTTTNCFMPVQHSVWAFNVLSIEPMAKVSKFGVSLCELVFNRNVMVLQTP